MMDNVARHLVDPQSTEYKFVADRFHQNWTSVNDPFSLIGPTVATLQAASTRTYTSGPSVQISFPSSNVPQPIQNQPGVPPPQIGPAQSAGLLPFPMWPPLRGQLPPPPAHLQPPLPAHLHVVRFSPSIRVPPTSVQFGPPLPTPPMQPTNRPVSSPLQTNPINPSLAIQMPTAKPQQPVMPPSSYRRRQARYHRPYNAPMPLPNIPPGQNTQPIGNLSHGVPNIIQIERIQNQRWYKQYLAHECEFRQKLRRDTQKWLFHGKGHRKQKLFFEHASFRLWRTSVEENRNGVFQSVLCWSTWFVDHSTRTDEWLEMLFILATALGQGCYFARDASYSDRYAAPDRQGICRMFLGNVSSSCLLSIAQMCAFSSCSRWQHHTRKLEYACSTAWLWYYWWWSNDIR